MKTRHGQVLVPSMPGAEAVKQVVLSDIHFKWAKFSDADLAGLKTRDDLVGQVAAKYGRALEKAGREVDALLDGRVI